MASVNKCARPTNRIEDGREGTGTRSGTGVGGGADPGVQVFTLPNPIPLDFSLTSTSPTVRTWSIAASGSG